MSNEASQITALITGSSGFLGKELIKQLLESKQYNVIAVTSQTDKLIKEVGVLSRLTIVDVRDWKNQLYKSMDIEFLINCAFPRTSDPEGLADGIRFTEELIAGAINANVKSIINISSQSVYTQNTKDIVDEQSPAIPESLYGMTKFACERIVALKCKYSKTPYTNIRLGSLVGIDLDVRMTNRFVQSALNGETITVNGGQQKVSYLHVKDAASALVKMLETDPKQWKPTYNLGNDQYFTVLELAETVKQLAKNYTDQEVSITINKGDSTFNNLVNSNLFYRDFNWKSRISMPRMVEELFDRYKKKG